MADLHVNSFPLSTAPTRQMARPNMALAAASVQLRRHPAPFFPAGATAPDFRCHPPLPAPAVTRPPLPGGGIPCLKSSAAKPFTPYTVY
jgi:hypothetical protein